MIFSKEDLNLISVNLHFIAARKHGLSEVSQEVYNLVSHATQERLRNILEKLSTISLHRLEVYRVCRTSLLKNSFFVFFYLHQHNYWHNFQYRLLTNPCSINIMTGLLKLINYLHARLEYMYVVNLCYVTQMKHCCTETSKKMLLVLTFIFYFKCYINLKLCC